MYLVAFLQFTVVYIYRRHLHCKSSVIDKTASILLDWRGKGSFSYWRDNVFFTRASDIRWNTDKLRSKGRHPHDCIVTLPLWVAATGYCGAPSRHPWKKFRDQENLATVVFLFIVSWRCSLRFLKLFEPLPTFGQTICLVTPEFRNKDMLVIRNMNRRKECDI